LHETADQLPVVVQGEVLDHGAGHDAADAVYLRELLDGDAARQFFAAETFGYKLRR
jgi:hypothetical protein